MKIEIEDFRFNTIIGILDFEREREQEVIFNISIEYNYNNEFINYAEITQEIKNSTKEHQFLLIEDALSTLSSTLKKKFPLIETLFIKITKPSIMPDCLVSVSDIYHYNS